MRAWVVWIGMMIGGCNGILGIGDVRSSTGADAPTGPGGDAPGDAPAHGLAQQAYVKASNTATNARFGGAIALSADGSTLAVGAPGEASASTGVGGDQGNTSAFGAGAVYVFTRTGATWTQQAYVKASNATSSMYFGWSVALSDDGATLAVGAWNERSAATGVGGNQGDMSVLGAGAAYVFTRAGTTWSQQAYIKASNTGTSDSFGYRLALSGDGATLAVGAYSESSASTGVGGNQADNTASGSGAVYVFARAGTAWSQQAYVKASNTASNDRFGWDLALSGDGATLAVGATGEDSAATGFDGNQHDHSAQAAGAVYVFARAGMTWSQQAYVKASNTDAQDQFGFSVALSADGATLAVGATGEDSAAVGVDGMQSDNAADGSGAVYLFGRAGTTWSQQAYVKASNTGASDGFGSSVALSSGGAALAVGAPYEASAATGVGGDQNENLTSHSGAAYLFARSGLGWAQQAYVKASNTGAGDVFGSSVALSSDGTTLATSAPEESSAATGIDADQSDNSEGSAGAVYLFR